MQEGEWDVVPNHRRLLQQSLLGGGERGDTRGEHRLYRGGDVVAQERPREVVPAVRALEHTSTDEYSHDLFDKERITAGAFRQETRQRWQTRVMPQHGLKKTRKTLPAHVYKDI